ncbi:MAG TPA: PKD domain-containing protein [Thermoplasmata archaeon]|nr:PKD domain-containing protein [Thermoplasmata archaeon]
MGATARAGPALGVGAVVVVAVLLLVAIGPVAAGPARASSAPAPARPPAPVPPAAARPAVPAAPAADVYSGAGYVRSTAFVNYNVTSAGNFASTVADWQLGTPAYVPSDRALWFPTVVNATGSYPVPEYGPTLMFSTVTDSFVGDIPALNNASALTYDPANSWVLGAISDNGTVEAFNSSSGSLVGAAAAVGTNPTALALDPTTQTLYVANEGSDTISVLDALTLEVLHAPLTTGSSPSSLADDPSDQSLFIADSGAPQIEIYDTATFAEYSPVLLTGDASSVAYSQSAGTVLAVVPSRTTAVLIDAASRGFIGGSVVGSGVDYAQTSLNGSEYILASPSANSVVLVNSSIGCTSCTTVPVGTAPEITATASSPFLAYAWNSVSRNVSILALSASTVVANSPSLGADPDAVAYDYAAGRLFVANSVGNYLTPLDPVTMLTSGDAIAVASPTTVVTDQASGEIYVGVAGGISVLDPTSGSVLRENTSIPGVSYPLAVDRPAGLVWTLNTVRGLLGLGLATLQATVDYPDLVDYTGPSQGTVNSNGSLFLVVDPTNDTLLAFNTTSGALQFAAGPLTPDAVGVAYDAADDDCYVLGENVSIVDSLTGLVITNSVVLPTHASSGAIVYDPSRAALYATATISTPVPSGALYVLDGSTPGAAARGIATLTTGQGPSGVISVALPGSSSAASDQIWTANSASGTVSMIASGLSIPSFTIGPSSVDVGQPVGLTVTTLGGAGATNLTYLGLPLGCDSQDNASFTCVPGASGVFSIEAIATDGLGDQATANASLNVSGSLSVTMTDRSASAPYFDVGSTVSLAAVVAGGALPYDYSWSFGDGASATGASSSHQYDAPGTYVVTVTVSDGNFATAQNSTAVTVFADPTVTVASQPGNRTEPGLPLLLVATVVGGSPLASAGWQPLAGETLAGTSVQTSWSAAGVYDAVFSATDAAGVSVGASLNVTVIPGPTATLAWSVPNETGSSEVSDGQNVTFVVTPTGGSGPYTVAWNFGDGSLASGPLEVSHVFGRTGNVTVTAEVTDGLGGSTSVSVVLSLQPAAVPASGASSGPNDLATGILLGLFVGLALGSVAVFLATRSRRRPPPPPSPYVPPVAVPWEER